MSSKTIFIRDRQLLDLYKLLNKRDYYSLSLKHTSKKTGIPEDSLRKLADCPEIFEDLIGDTLNIFKYNKVTYIGLETRRIDYDKDAANGNNWVEDAIKEGLYD